ncbi:Metallo-dependent phosphatase-like protein [Plectosphaerella plurivora]|uniref:Metallo-dependent phosphatase-like protein n=1 Tax=Plectosphaerella plurivora TaxID=936078 RepID=A0A9P8V5G9_9PEZI|nr:Metallo-dependent phosphatase-like protein [Plectosphaerella plurivora]
MFGFNASPPEPYLEAPSLSFLIARHPLKGLLHTAYNLVNGLRTEPRPRPDRRPVRIVCISDTHTLIPGTVPDGDVLIHAGDLTNDGTVADLQKKIDWIDSLPHTYKIAIAGNHDTYLDPKTRVSLPAAQRADGLLSWKSIHYLQHSAVTLAFPSGRHLKFYGAPQIPACGPYETFAFQHPRSEDTWTGTVPDDTDILITHAPPKHHRDIPVPSGLGCGFLLAEVRRVKPICHIFGHVHWGAGRELCWWEGVQDAYERGLEAPAGRGLWSLMSLRLWASLATVVVFGFWKAAWSRVSPASSSPTIMVNAAQMKGHTGRLGNPPQVLDI